MSWLEASALVVSWFTLGAVGGIVSNEGWRWAFGRNESWFVHAGYTLVGPFGLLTSFVVEGGSCLQYWKHGRSSRREVEDAKYPRTTISQNVPSSGLAYSAFIRAALEPPALEPPVQEAWTPDPVLAWRWWTLNTERLTLVGNVARWESGTMEATHVGDGFNPYSRAVEAHDKAPHPGCLCGVNALKVSEVYEYAKQLFHPYPGIFVVNRDPTPVVGRVALTGIVDEYEKGYRAEKAEIIELVVLSDAPIFKVPGVLDALEERYGVRPTVQSRESWLAEMEVIHGYGKENQADHQRAGADPAGTASGTGQGTSQDFLTARLNRWSSIYMVPADDKDDGLSGVKNS